MIRSRFRNAHRPAFTLIEMMVVICIMAVLIGLLLPAVQKVREAANRAACVSNFRQIGLALHGCHDAIGYLPPGMITESNILDSYHTAFTYLLPYLEQGNVSQIYNFNAPWSDTSNYAGVAVQIPVFYCPSNRNRGMIDLTPYIEQWSCPMPPFVGACDYVLCKGANAGFGTDPSAIPTEVRGLFNVALANVTAVQDQAPFGPTPQFRVSLDGHHRWTVEHVRHWGGGRRHSLLPRC